MISNPFAPIPTLCLLPLAAPIFPCPQLPALPSSVPSLFSLYTPLVPAPNSHMYLPLFLPLQPALSFPHFYFSNFSPRSGFSPISSPPPFPHWPSTSKGIMKEDSPSAPNPSGPWQQGRTFAKNVLLSPSGPVMGAHLLCGEGAHSFLLAQRSWEGMKHIQYR